MPLLQLLADLRLLFTESLDLDVWDKDRDGPPLSTPPGEASVTVTPSSSSSTGAEAPHAEAEAAAATEEESIMQVGNSLVAVCIDYSFHFASQGFTIQQLFLK